jgi:hypothetical protein
MNMNTIRHSHFSAFPTGGAQASGRSHTYIDAPATSGVLTLRGSFFSRECSGTSSTGRVKIREKRSATLPSTSRRQPRRPCVPMTTRSAPKCFAAAMIL